MLVIKSINQCRKKCNTKWSKTQIFSSLSQKWISDRTLSNCLWVSNYRISCFMVYSKPNVYLISSNFRAKDTLCVNMSTDGCLVSLKKLFQSPLLFSKFSSPKFQCWYRDISPLIKVKVHWYYGSGICDGKPWKFSEAAVVLAERPIKEKRNARNPDWPPYNKNACYTITYNKRLTIQFHACDLWKKYSSYNFHSWKLYDKHFFHSKISSLKKKFLKFFFSRYSRTKKVLRTKKRFLNFFLHAKI